MRLTAAQRADLDARYAAHPPQRGRLTFDWNPGNVPLPRVRWSWDGPKFAWITVELSEAYADAVVGVTWMLPSWLSIRIDAALSKVRK